MAGSKSGSSSSERAFGGVFTVFFLVLALLGWRRGWPGPVVYLVFASLMLAVTLTVPAVLAPLNRLWMRFGELMHFLVSPVIAGAIFFLAVTPLALFFRLIGRDAMNRRFDPGAASYWKTRSDFQEAAKGFYRQF